MSSLRPLALAPVLALAGCQLQPQGTMTSSNAQSMQKFAMSLQEAMADGDWDRAERLVHEQCDVPEKKQELGPYAGTYCAQYKSSIRQQRAMARYSTDSDDDGASDAIDRCPGVKGTPQFQGCNSVQEMAGMPAPSGGATASFAAAPPMPAGPPPTFVAAAPQASAYALVVGVERYRDVPAASGARADAEAFAAFARQTLGIKSDHLRLATEDHATRSDLLAGVEWLVRSTPAGGRAYFYFSGHGAPNASDQSAYLLPYDGDPRDVDATAVPLATVMRRLGEARAKDAIAFVDSCFSGAGGRSVLPAGARPLMRVKDAAPPSHLALFTASGGDEISGPAHGERGGAFTKYLLQGLGSGRADQNGDGQIALDELSSWVAPRVAQDAQQDRRAQHPRLVMGSAAGDPSGFIVEYGLPTP